MNVLPESDKVRAAAAAILASNASCAFIVVVPRPGGADPLAFFGVHHHHGDLDDVAKMVVAALAGGQAMLRSYFAEANVVSTCEAKYVEQLIRAREIGRMQTAHVTITMPQSESEPAPAEGADTGPTTGEGGA